MMPQKMAAIRRYAVPQTKRMMPQKMAALLFSVAPATAVVILFVVAKLPQTLEDDVRNL